MFSPLMQGERSDNLLFPVVITDTVIRNPAHSTLFCVEPPVLTRFSAAPTRFFSVPTRKSLALTRFFQLLTHAKIKVGGEGGVVSIEMLKKNPYIPCTGNRLFRDLFVILLRNNSTFSTHAQLHGQFLFFCFLQQVRCFSSSRTPGRSALLD